MPFDIILCHNLVLLSIAIAVTHYQLSLLNYLLRLHLPRSGIA